MENEYKKIILMALISSMLCMYLCTAFVLGVVSFNPMEWKDFQRFIFLGIWVIIFLSFASAIEHFCKLTSEK